MPGMPTYQSSIGASQMRVSSTIAAAKAAAAPACAATAMYLLKGRLRAVTNCAPWSNVRRARGASRGARRDRASARTP